MTKFVALFALITGGSRLIKHLLLLAVLALAGCGAAAVVQHRNAENEQAKTQIISGVKAIRQQCEALLSNAQLDPIRGKVAFWVDQPLSFSLLIVDSRPTPVEQSALVAWADVRKDCYTRVHNLLAALPLPPDMDEDIKQKVRAGLASFADQQLQAGNFLTAALYTGQMTYGDFNRKRAEAYRTSATALQAWLNTLDVQDRAQTAQRAEAAEQQAEGAALLLKAAGCIAGARNRFVQAMCQ